MSANTPDSQTYAQSPNLLENNLGIEVPVVPPFRFGPDSWNLIFYMILAVSLLFGFMAFASTGSWSDALLYFFISLLGTTFLSVSFLSFVIMPLFLKHRERVIAARKAAELATKAAEIERAEQMLAERYRTRPASNQGADPSLHNQVVFSEQESPDAPVSAAQPAAKPAVEDQASSLRRMVGAGK